MIDALKSDEIVNKAGGRFKLCALVQRRLVQLMEGARPLVDRDGRSDLEIAMEEILQNKITLQFTSSVENLLPPAEVKRLKAADRAAAAAAAAAE
ncbi:MAG: DNA-directed RNA polymerase subunit omega [Planctomycetota bacterium]|nr:DNA-directed RNA polymerase subunit omega [Planctomycetota bacterium]